MGVLIRPRFCQPCFDCGEPVSTQRIQALQHNAEIKRRRWLKSDLLCVYCANKRETAERVGVPYK
jgi:RNA polymerase-binding transcription factor DksA